MNEKEKNEIIQVFNTLANIELSFAELYEANSKFWVNEADFWLSLAREERDHVAYVKNMSQIIQQAPDQFIQGKPFRPISLQTAEQTAKTLIHKINSSQIDREEIFNIALDIENSILESKYNDILKTENSLYRDSVDKLVKDTYKHSIMIQQKLDEINKARHIV